jgi:hypothetical protein
MFRPAKSLLSPAPASPPPPSRSLALDFQRPTRSRSFVSPFFATLTGHAQLIENSATLTPVFATLTEKRRGVGLVLEQLALSACRPVAVPRFAASCYPLFTIYQAPSALFCCFLHFFALFCVSQKATPPLFKHIHALCAKTPGWRYGPPSDLLAPVLRCPNSSHLSTLLIPICQPSFASPARRYRLTSPACFCLFLLPSTRSTRYEENQRDRCRGSRSGRDRRQLHLG